MQASSITEIALLVNNTYFRIRNVFNLRDYLVIEKPNDYFVHVYSLDPAYTPRSFVNSDLKRYILLSTKEEVKYLNSLDDIKAIQEASRNYVRFNNHSQNH